MNYGRKEQGCRVISDDQTERTKGDQVFNNYVVIIYKIMFISFKGWERHGGYCYKIDSTPRSFEHASSGYFCPSALVSVTNR